MTLGLSHALSMFISDWTSYLSLGTDVSLAYAVTFTAYLLIPSKLKASYTVAQLP